MLEPKLLTTSSWLFPGYPGGLTIVSYFKRCLSLGVSVGSALPLPFPCCCCHPGTLSCLSSDGSFLVGLASGLSLLHTPLSCEWQSVAENPWWVSAAHRVRSRLKSKSCKGLYHSVPSFPFSLSFPCFRPCFPMLWPTLLHSL